MAVIGKVLGGNSWNYAELGKAIFR